jgi:hypothetical protein
MLNPSLPMVAGLTLVLGCSLISGCVNAAPEHTPAADPPGTETAHWDVTVSNRRVTGLRYDPGGQARFGRQLLSEPLELLADGEPLDLEQDRVRVEDNGRTLVIAAGNDRPLTVKWPLQLSHAGYFDRLTGASLQNEGHDDPALLRFVSGGKGHTCVVEAAKRLDHGLWGLSNPGTTVIVKTRDSVQFVLDHGPGGSTSFPFENDRLTPTFQCPRGSLILRAYAEPEAIILEDGSPLPEFVFGNNTEVRTGTGGRSTSSTNRQRSGTPRAMGSRPGPRGVPSGTRTSTARTAPTAGGRSSGRSWAMTATATTAMPGPGATARDGRSQGAMTHDTS